MTAGTQGFQLRFLGFFGPQKPAATVAFGPGLNVVYGASNAGKSTSSSLPLAVVKR